MAKRQSPTTPTPTTIAEKPAEPTAQASFPAPTVGRIVHYVLPTGPQRGAHRAAMVSDVSESGLVSLHVFKLGQRDTGNPAFTPRVDLIDDVKHDEDGMYPGTWHWPERTV